MLRILYDQLYAALLRATEHLGLRGERAALCARLFAETTCDGVYTHGLNRFPRFAQMVANGCIQVDAEPVRVSGAAALERWDGRLGPGNISAWHTMERTLTLAREYGIGAVALSNTNHWMRGGSYGWQAAEAGMFGVCWTNTLPNLPAWGSASPVLGNNPLVIAIPHRDGDAGRHIVLDMAMSQFSYGALSSYAARSAMLPVPGGYDENGELTRDPSAIEASKRALPVGYWKGAGLSTVLDLVAAMLSGGKAAHEIPQDPTRESGVSQIFIAIDSAALGGREELDSIAAGVLESLKAAPPLEPGRPVRYPGEQTLHLREENMRLGVPVDPEVWKAVQTLSF
ncbi:MAG TPA: 3-dehydro-L-gulonate 2-dehydrogenase [Acidobacteriaceae bacterium]|nr:3-dehydro-L-gulonate 2-dehydrogenase [Acidobacteriaceae bacterium]